MLTHCLGNILSDKLQIIDLSLSGIANHKGWLAAGKCAIHIITYLHNKYFYVEFALASIV